MGVCSSSGGALVFAGSLVCSNPSQGPWKTAGQGRQCILFSQNCYGACLQIVSRMFTNDLNEGLWTCKGVLMQSFLQNMPAASLMSLRKATCYEDPSAGCVDLLVPSFLAKHSGTNRHPKRAPCPERLPSNKIVKSWGFSEPHLKVQGDPSSCKDPNKPQTSPQWAPTVPQMEAEGSQGL